MRTGSASPATSARPRSSRNVATRVSSVSRSSRAAWARTRCSSVSAPRTPSFRPFAPRPGAMVGWVGVPHVTDLPQEHMFWKNVGLRGGPAPVRAYLPDLLDRVWNSHIEPGNVFDLTLPLDQVAEEYAAMDERGAIKTLLRP